MIGKMQFLLAPTNMTWLLYGHNMDPITMTQMYEKRGHF